MFTFLRQDKPPEQKIRVNITWAMTDT